MLMKEIKEWKQPDYDSCYSDNRINKISMVWLYDFILEPELLSIRQYDTNPDYWLCITPPADVRMNGVNGKLYLNFPYGNAGHILNLILLLNHTNNGQS